MLCKIKKPDAAEEPSSLSSKLYNFFVGLFWRKSYVAKAEDVKTEL
jgi:hypothetical protein